jgi:hypothetical protein
MQGSQGHGSSARLKSYPSEVRRALTDRTLAKSTMDQEGRQGFLVDARG